MDSSATKRKKTESSSNQTPQQHQQLLVKRAQSFESRASMEKMVMENVLSGEREARISAANELVNLTAKQRHKLAERGVVAPLVSMLHSRDCEAIEAALFALLSLAFGSERTKIKIVKSGAISALTNLLQNDNKSLVELTVTSLMILSSSKPNKLPIASSGAVQTLLNLLNDEHAPITAQTELDTVATLHNLSTRRETVPILISSGAILTLLRLVHRSEKSSELVSRAVNLLGDLVFSSEDAIQESASAIGVLVEAVEEGSPECREHAVRILLGMCRRCRETYREMILREGVVPGLLQVSVDGTWRARAMAAELLILLRDCDYSRSERSENELLLRIMEEIDGEEGGVVDIAALSMVEEMIARLGR